MYDFYLSELDCFILVWLVVWTNDVSKTRQIVIVMNNDDDNDVDFLFEGENAPTNPELWSRAKSAARSKFDKYPSAYANLYASKWYKKRGGGWRKKKKKKANESLEQLKDIIKEEIKEWKRVTSSGNRKQFVANTKKAKVKTKQESYLEEDTDDTLYE